jgi:uncharacterized protein YcbK (DUF882 family)
MLWNRAYGVWRSNHFSPKECECKCGVCTQQRFDDKLLKMLEEVREEVGLPIKITSGFRCARYQEILRNKGYETAVGTSSHEMGMAADIRCDDMLKLETACLRVFANYSLGKSNTFIHLDIRSGGPRRWSYKI